MSLKLNNGEIWPPIEGKGLMSLHRMILLCKLAMASMKNRVLKSVWPVLREIFLTFYTAPQRGERKADFRRCTVWSGMMANHSLLNPRIVSYLPG